MKIDLCVPFLSHSNSFLSRKAKYFNNQIK